MALSSLRRVVIGNMRVFVCLGVILIAGPDLVSAESIRVLIFQDVSRVEVRADGAMIIERERGNPLEARVPVHFAWQREGITGNGVQLGRDSVTVRSMGNLLTVLVPPGSATMKGNASNGPHVMEVSGDLRILARGQRLMVINYVDLEEYVKGVVPSEVNPAWHMEMLKTQAVAARTYVLYHHMLSAIRDFDVMATVQDQVYRGRAGVDRRIEQAVEATRGLVVTYYNAPIYAAFSSTAAGPTEDAMNVWSKDLPYLKGVECPFDLSSPHYQWKVSVKMEDLEGGLRREGFRLGTIATVSPLALSRAGRVTKLRILHSRGELIVRGEEFRKAVGYAVIPSTQFEIESVGREVVFAGYGAGHAVGLCQWGAKELAELGYAYPVILQYYYPGTELQNAAFVQPPPSPSS